MTSTPVHLIATGGTIASHHDGAAWTTVDGATLVADAEHAAPGSTRDVVVDDVATGSSSNLSTSDMVAIARRIADRLADGAAGVVVTHGTDTIELTSFVTQLLLGVDPGRAPVVFTGSMRVHSDAEPDGTANLVAALRIARDARAVGREVLVCIDGEIHAADRVHKVDARSLDAFTSAPFEPVGTVTRDALRFFDDIAIRRPAARDLVGDVGVLCCHPGVTGEDVHRAAAGRDALVVEAFGDLNAPSSTWGAMHELTARGTVVVLASRSYTDRVDDDDLRLLGAVGCAGLDAQRARLATMAALSTSNDRAHIVEFLRSVGVVHDAGGRGSRPGRMPS
jgi:L-asparaginase